MKSELNELWNQSLAILQQDLSRPVFETLIKNTRPLAYYEDSIIVAVQNHFAREWISEKYSGLMQKTLEEVTGKEIKLHLIVPEPDEEQAVKTEDFTRVTQEELALTVPATKITNERNTYTSQPLNPKYVFETFVIGNSNRLAHAAALAVAEAPARAYNPLFIYGGVGLGKTHLMQAIAHQMLRKNPHARVVYVSSETFTNELINSIRDSKTIEFRNRYRTVDILLVDDIQFLAGKEGTQEEFFHTFNALHEANKQIVISSDRPPKEIPTLEDRLRSRFEWGLISDIKPPDLETRNAILRKKAQLEDLDVADDIIRFIAERIDTNIRELEGALIRLVAQASLTGTELSVDFAKETLKDILPAAKNSKISINTIQEVVAEYYDLKVKDMKIRKRTRSVAFPRQIAMYLCRELTDASLPKIGEEFGGRDHTTVMHACDKIREDMERNPDIEETIRVLTEKIKNK